VTNMENHYLKGPKPFGYMYVGIAIRPG